MEKLLVIGASVGISKQLAWGLGTEFAVLHGGDYLQAMAQFRTVTPKVVVLDLGVPPDPEGGSEGFRCLHGILASQPGAKVVVLIENGARETAHRAIQCGAYDFYQKPVRLEELKIVIRRAFHLSGIEEERNRLREALQEAGATSVESAGDWAGTGGGAPVDRRLTLREARDRVEKGLISTAVGVSMGNLAKASELLGVSRPTLYDLLKKHGLFKPAARP